jgi:antitoxin (DNA-binding transcriptional repressor) of toxin-antitoxin stability system
MKTLNIKDISPALLELVRTLGEDPVVLLHRGKPVAALLPVSNADLETVSLSLNPQFLAIIERSRTGLRQKGGFSSEDLRKEFGVLPRRATKPKANRRKSNGQQRKAVP